MIIDKSILISKIVNHKNDLAYQLPSLSNKNKFYCYQAFENLLNKFPQEMSEYLIKSTRTGGFQSKVFQEYIFLLEKALPIFYFKNKKPYSISSLLDDKLNIFDGISIFEGVVNDKLCIKNNTKEFYVGGRKGYVAKPFYIGKILNIIHKQSKDNLLNNIKNYSFNQINMQDISINTPVIITHLRVSPHYQMGGMAYVNNVRKHIIGSI